MIIVTNSQMGCCCLERNGIFASNGSQISSVSGGFSICRRPIFGIALRAKKAKHIRVFSLTTSNCRTIGAFSNGESDKGLAGGGLIEKEFEFKPSFDEYLKAMESVTTGRKQKKDNLKAKDVLRTPLFERDEEIVKMKKFEAHSRRKASSVTKQDGLSENFSGDIGQGLIRGKFRERERGSGEMKDESKMELFKGYSGKGSASNGEASYLDVQVKRNVKGETTNGRWLKNHSSTIDKEFDKSMLSKSMKARRSREHPGVLDVVKNIGSSVDTGEKLGHKEKFSGMLERKEFYRSQRDDKLNGKTFEIERQVLKSADMGKRHERNHAQGEKFTTNKSALKNGAFARGSKAFLDRGNDDNFEMEKAAVKTFDVFNDVMDKPRVSRMEMEERIQKLAK